MKSTRNPSRSPFILAASAAVLLGFLANPAHAQERVWNLAPGTNGWNTAANWTAPNVPNAAGESARFQISGTTNLNISSSVSPDGILFDAGASAFTINKGTNVALNLNGSGIINNSGILQTINNNSTLSRTIFNNSATVTGNVLIQNTGFLSTTTFNGSSSAGSAQILNSAGAVLFTGNSSAANATISNTGPATTTTFTGNSTAGAATITNAGTGSSTNFTGTSNAGTATITNAGNTSFTSISGNSSGGQAAVTNTHANAVVDISQLATSGTTLGSIAGTGTFYLGNNNLEVGGNNQSTEVTGVIRDGGPFSSVEVGGSLTKVGTGTLTLSGANLYTGATTVNGGSLIVNGSTVSAETVVNQLGLLGGSGLIGGNLTNFGVLSPGNSPGTLTVTGNFTQASTGNFRLEIASTTQYDRLAVAGGAALGGTLSVFAVDGYKPKRGDIVTFLTAGGGVLGEFSELDDSTINNQTILDFEVIYGANQVSLEFVQGSFADLPGLTPNQTAVAKALDQVAFGTTVPGFIDYLNYQPINDLPALFDKIAPEELASVFNIAYSLSNIQMTNLERRMAEVRGGSTGFSGTVALQGDLPQQGFAGVTGSDGKSFKDTKETKVIPTPPEENRWGFFVTGAGEFVDIESTYNAKGYDFQSGGITLGVDYRVCENFAVGLTVGYAHTGVDLTGEADIGVDAGRIGVYATTFVGGFYLDAAVSGGYASYDIRRDALDGSAYGDTTSGELDTYVGIGYDFKAGALTFGPFGNFQYTYVDLDGFTENGSLAPLKYDQQSNESIRTTLGLKASYEMKVLGRAVRPSVRLGWQHEFADTAVPVTAAFATGGNNFTVHGPDIGEDAFLVGAGFTIQISETASAYLYYDGEFRSNYELNAISGGVRLAF